ncbi:methyltransferase domain-containing protein [Stieleria marina]|uniref:Methyltransferase domain-containing protein n=1 Tax=Stieleria marina TaxID=1930275 RepID=A0A517NW95_9BACT|nr:hypothetical protein K239x_33900 [Planctomycetes bacterium K23_9]
MSTESQPSGREPSDWLSLRAQYDARSRSVALAEQWVTYWQEQLRSDGAVIDLACGTGTNLRFLQPLQKVDTSWVGFDNDSRVIDLAREQSAHANCEFIELNLADQLRAVPIDSAIAVTTSAFLDMTSVSWLDRLATRLASKPFLAAMTASGPLQFLPTDPLDATIGDQLAIHQTSDHGFGPSIGVGAAPYLADRLRGQGNEITIADSSWRLTAADADLQRFLVKSIGRRVRGMSPAIGIDRWISNRMDQIDADELVLTVPHCDLLSLPADRRNR